MVRKIVIIESDSAFSQRVRTDFEPRGFTVLEISDGKASVDLVKRERPDLVLLAVELSAGQSGYIVCGKLKKDEELKKIPIIIMGKDAEGFESHKRLKARAEDYIRKPFELPELIDKVAALIGLPRADSADLVLEEDESLGLTNSSADESLATNATETRAGDPELDMLDTAFETLTNGDMTQSSVDSSLDEGLLEEPPPVGSDSPGPLLELEEQRSDVPEEIALDALDAIVEIPSGEQEPPFPPPAAIRPPRLPSSPVAALDDAELRTLRDRVGELESRARELEDDLTSKTNELEAVRSTSGGKDKEFFSLREQVSKKDKEILRLRQDLTEHDKELVELRDKELMLDQQVSELTTELAKREAQIKTLNQRAEAFAVDRKKLDLNFVQAKDDIRQLNANLSAAQAEIEQIHASNAELDQALEAARSETAATGSELDKTRGELAATLSALDAAHSEIERIQVEANRAVRLDEEALGLRARIAELEGDAAKNEDRIVQAYQKIKFDEKLRDKTKKALAVALSMLEESSTPDELKGGDGVAAS